ncbi:cingulin isoform X4 [Myxocyprinus asiaticus]|uniref:cingulin isoform X4 n=1 Tax=Myxocyprinus asiaticus TaxID=70543 RepID=UPI0022235B22|nr:cingulin isoform X4 [Myxocyprinus asiaticus]
MCTVQDGKMFQDMEQRLLDEGLDSSASSEERLHFLWNLYMSSESTVSSLNQQIQDLHKERVAEIEKVQQYVSHIKSLTKTRDSVALHLEQENETLRGTIEDIRLQQETQRSEIAEMLLQEGLADIIPISLCEQVAYLLADRASLQEKTQSQDVDMKATCYPDGQKEPTSQGLGENVVEVAPRQVQSPWKRLLGLKKAAQSKQKLTPVVDSQYCGNSNLKVRTLQELERDVEEASARLTMAHKEIRRLTDELESAHLTQKAYEPELQEAQMKVELLRQEVEKLKRCDVAELQKTKETNKKLEEDLCHLRETVKILQAERLQLQVLDENSDSTTTPPQEKTPQEENIHKRCLEEMQERLSVLQDMTQVTFKLQVEFEMEADLRRRAEEECEEHKLKRIEAEQLVRDFQRLCEKQAEDYRTTTGSLHVEIRDLVTKLQELEAQEVERQCKEHLKQLSSLDDEICNLKSVIQEMQEKMRQQATAMQRQIDQTKALVQSQEVQLQQDAEKQKRLAVELQSTQNILSTTKLELLSERENNAQLLRNITDLEQGNLKQLQEYINDLESRLTSSQQETESLRTELQLTLVSVDAERRYNNKRIRYKNKLSRAKGVYLREIGWRDEKIKDLEKEIFILKKQEEKRSNMMEIISSENETLLQKTRDLFSQQHDLEEAQKNALDTVSSMQMRIHLLEEENIHLQRTTAQMSERIECLAILAETNCDNSSSPVKTTLRLYKSCLLLILVYFL